VAVFPIQSLWLSENYYDNRIVLSHSFGTALPFNHHGSNFNYKLPSLSPTVAYTCVNWNVVTPMIMGIKYLGAGSLKADCVRLKMSKFDLPKATKNKTS